MFLSSTNNTTSILFLDLVTVSTPFLFFDENVSQDLSGETLFKYANLTCTQIKYQYISQKALFNIVRYVSHNLNRFFLLPALILNLCAFYILQRTRMNRSSSIAFYMQILALSDVAFFALRVLFGELSSLSANKHILTTSLCRFLFLMVNAVNYITVWLIAAMNVDKFLAVCLPLRVSDLLSRKKAYAVVIAVIILSMSIASVHASRTVLKENAYCWLEKPEDEKLVFILDAFVWCFIPFIVISILNAAIFVALLRARREASQLHESTAAVRANPNSTLRASMNNRAKVQSQNLQITVMLITVSISFFVLTLPNVIYHLLIFLRVLIESWKAVKCDAYVYRNLDSYVRTSAVMYLVSHILSDLMHVVNFFLYFISGARFRSEFHRLLFHRLCRWSSKRRMKSSGKEFQENSRSFIRSKGVATVRSFASLPATKQKAGLGVSPNMSVSDRHDSPAMLKPHKQFLPSTSLSSSSPSSLKHADFAAVPMIDEENPSDSRLNHII